MFQLPFPMFDKEDEYVVPFAAVYERTALEITSLALVFARLTPIMYEVPKNSSATTSSGIAGNSKFTSLVPSFISKDQPSR